MPTLTVYGDTSDGQVQSSNATYATARAGSGLVANTGGFTNGVGQLYSGGSYLIQELFLSFDTSAIPDDATITSVTLSMYGSSDNSETDFDIEARLHDWGASLTTADWVAGADLSTKTLLATFNTAGFSAAGYNAFTSDAAFISNINKSGSTRLLLASSRQRTNNAPSTSHPGDGESVSLYLADNPGTTNDPKLVIEYTVPEVVSIDALAQGVATAQASLSMNPLALSAEAQGTASAIGKLSNLTAPVAPDYKEYDAYANAVGLLLLRGEGAENRNESLALSPPQQDVGNNPDDIPSALGKFFAQSDFSHGTGQPAFDLQSSDKAKGLYSEGYDISEIGRLKHLPATATADDGALTAGSAGRSAKALGKIFIAEGNGVRVYDTITGSSTTEDPHAGEGAVAVQDLTSAGDLVYAALGANGVHVRSAAGTWTHWSDALAIRVAFLKGRLIATTARLLYEITASGAAPSAKSTLNEGWSFTALAEADFIYAACVYEAGGQSRVLHYGPDSSLNFIELGSSTLPDDDLCYALKGYLGRVVVAGGRKNSDGGKDTLIYDAIPSQAGDLPLSLIMDSKGAGSADLSCKAIATRGRRFLFGWTLGEDAPFGGRTGIAMYDPALGAFAHHLASELDPVTPRQVLSVQVFEGRIVFVTLDGVYYEDTGALVEQATYISSRSTRNNAGLKNWDESRFSIAPLPEGSTVQIYYTTEDPEDNLWAEGALVTGEGITEGSARHPDVDSAGLAIKLVSTSDGETGPEIDSFAVRFNPTVEAPELRLIRTFRIFAKDRGAETNQAILQDPAAVHAFLLSLYMQPFAYYEANANYSVRMTAFSDVLHASYTDRDGNTYEDGYIFQCALEGVQN